MKKFVIVQKNKAERVVCCGDASAVDLKEGDSLVEVDISRKVRKGEPFYVATRTVQPVVKKSKWKITVGVAVGAAAAASAAAYYFMGGI
jgi:hypothetical protein